MYVVFCYSKGRGNTSSRFFGSCEDMFANFRYVLSESFCFAKSKRNVFSKRRIFAILVILVQKSHEISRKFFPSELLKYPDMMKLQ